MRAGPAYCVWLGFLWEKVDNYSFEIIGEHMESRLPWPGRLQFRIAVTHVLYSETSNAASIA